MDKQFNSEDYSMIDFLDKKVVIKSKENNSFLLESVVIEDNKSLRSIQVRTTDAQKLKREKTVFVLFVVDEIPIQFVGKVRSVYIDNAVEIAISKGAVLRQRKYTRFTAKIPTVINSVFIQGQEVFFNKEIDALIADLSAEGLAVEAPPLVFERGDIIRLKYSLNNQEEVEYMYEVMRVSPINVDTSSYGCKIASI